MAHGKNFSLDELKSHLHYEPETGKFFWLVKRKGVNPGDEAGCLNPGNGRWRVAYMYRLHSRYRLAWFYMTGKWPNGEIDHINGDRADDRWENLRDVTRDINCQNSRRAHRDSKSGELGVWFHEGNRKWCAQIATKVNGKTKMWWLGGYDGQAAASAAYMAAKVALHPESDFAHGLTFDLSALRPIGVKNVMRAMEAARAQNSSQAPT